MWKDVEYPFKIKLVDLRYPNLDYLITVKDSKDWTNLKSLELNPQYKIIALTKKSKQNLQNS